MTERAIQRMNDIIVRFERGESPQDIAFQSEVTRFEMIQILHWQWRQLNNKPNATPARKKRSAR